MAETGATAWRWLIAGEFRAFPMRFVLPGLAIAIGVALAFAVHVINRSAAESFGQAVRSAAGGADLQVRGASALGFDESLYPKLMAHSVVADASPVVQLRAMIGEQARPVPLSGLDIFRTQTVSQSLVIRPRLARIGAGTRSTDLDALLDQEALDLSPAAMTKTRLGVGDRVDVKLKPETALGDAKAQLSSILPANTQLSDAETETHRGDALSRAYRVNLDMLALVALLTGGFLVYSAQSLAVTRRLRQFALLRTLGLQERALAGQLLGEGAALGVVGALIGLVGGYAIAGVALHLVGGDLGAGYFVGATTRLEFAPEAAVLFFSFGVATALAGSYAPARRAARIAPTLALKDAGDQGDPRRPPSILPAVAMIGAGTVCAVLPAVNRLPLFGYLAVGRRG